jgi:hypothetical protein
MPPESTETDNLLSSDAPIPELAFPSLHADATQSQALPKAANSLYGINFSHFLSLEKIGI